MSAADYVVYGVGAFMAGWMTGDTESKVGAVKKCVGICCNVQY